MDLLTWLRQEAQLKKMILLIVFLAFFVDHMLLSVVVPILPSYLYSTSQAAAAASGHSINLTLHPTTNHSLILDSTFAPPNGTPALLSDPSWALKFPESNCSYTDGRLDEVNVRVGLLLASKSTIQLIINPFIGPLFDRIGYHIPMCAGFCILVFATTWMGMLADTFKEDQERGRAMGISFTGLALGLITGAPFGSLMYQFLGKMAPFLVIAVIALLAGGLHALIFKTSMVQTQMEKGTPLLTLLKDPYILIAAGAICLATLVIATIETALPIWMMKTMCASKWQLGAVFLTDSISYLIASNIFGHLSPKYSAGWLCACIGMILAGITTISFGFSKNIYHVLVLNASVGFSIGVVDSSIMPLMGNLVDLRYVPAYSTVYAIADVAICIGFSVGPTLAGPIVASIGFPWLMAIIGTVNIIFAPLCIFLYNPPRQEEHLSILKEIENGSA